MYSIFYMNLFDYKYSQQYLNNAFYIQKRKPSDVTAERMSGDIHAQSKYLIKNTPFGIMLT